MKILLCDDHKLLCDGLRALLTKEPDMQVVAEAHDGRTALRLAREHAPDVVIMDAVMPDLNGIDATRQLRVELPRTRVVALSMHTDRRYVAGMLAAGASAYVVKDCAFDELVHAVRLVHQGSSYLSPSIAGIVIDHFVQRSSPAQPTAPAALSPREREVLQLLAEGHSSKTAAAKLHVSTKTVETHRRNIMQKLELDSLAELTKYAVREGLTSLDAPTGGRR